MISLRPNGSTTNYGPGSIHWQGHEPNVTWAHGVAWVGKSQPNFLPLCATHWGRDGNLMCTGEMNTQTGMFRMIDSNSVFITSSTCGNNPAYPSCMIADNLENSWRDQTSNITWLILHFDGAPGFRGRFTLYGKK